MLEIAVTKADFRPPEARTRQDYESFLSANLSRLNALAFSYARPDADLAKDIVQEAVVKGFQAFMGGTLQLDGQARAWFGTVIRNEFLMYRRKNRRLVGEPNDQTPGRDGRRDFENLSMRELLNAAIDELPEDQRECVVLVDLHQFDYEEAAAILGIPLGTVRSRLSRARMKLAQRLNSLECSL